MGKKKITWLDLHFARGSKQNQIGKPVFTLNQKKRAVSNIIFSLLFASNYVVAVCKIALAGRSLYGKKYVGNAGIEIQLRGVNAAVILRLLFWALQFKDK